MSSRVGFFIPLDNTNKILQQFISVYDSDLFELHIFCEAKGDGFLSAHCSLRKIPCLILNSKKRMSRAFEILKLIKKHKIDIILINSYPLNLYVIFLRAFNRSTKIIFVRHHNQIHYIQRNMKAQFLDFFTHKFAHHIIAVSNEVKRTLIGEKCPKHKISVVYNGVDIQSIPLRSPKRPYFSEFSPVKIIMIGRVVWEKDYGTAIDIVFELEKDGIVCELSIIGSGNKIVADEVINMAKKKLNRSQVTFIGWDSNIGKYLKRGHIFLHTSLDEALGMSVIEAYFSAIPVVAISNGAIREIQECVGDKIIATKMEATRSIEYIIGNYWLASKKSIEMSKIARNVFNIRDCFNEYSEIINFILVGKHN